MSRTRVLVASEDKRDPLLEQARDYLTRAGRSLDAELCCVGSSRRGKGAARDAEAREAAALLEASEGCTRVALDAGGRAMSSRELADQLELLKARGKPLAFLIGGASGLAPEVREASDVVWSLSPLTFPHRLAALVLCEQLYRAGEIMRGGPYAR